MKLNNKGTFTDVRLNFFLASLCLGVLVGFIDFTSPNYRPSLLEKIDIMPSNTIWDKINISLISFFVQTPTWISAIIITMLSMGFLMLLWRLVIPIFNKNSK